MALAGLLTLPGFIATAADSSAGQKPVFEEWVLVMLAGKPCGYGSTITTQIETPDGPGFHTNHQEEFVVKRLGDNLKISEISDVTEDADGGVINFEETTSSAGSSIESKGVREGDDLVVTGRGQTQRYHIPRLAALGPEKIRRLCNAVPLKPGQTYSFSTFSSEYPQAIVEEKGTIVGQETRNVRGVDRKLWKMTSESSMAPGLLSTSWVDDQSNDVENVTVVPGIGDIHEYVTDKAECLKQPEGAEIFTTNLIRPQEAIPSPGQQGQAVYRLMTVDLSKKLELWNQGEQKVVSSEPGTCEIEVTSRAVSPDDIDWRLPHADTPELHPYLQPSTYLEVDSPEIRALARRAIGHEDNPVKAAHMIEEFVRGYITKKDLRIAFASAQETAKSREGDCTEHAVLCAALGRAVGLPTRCVIGLGYIPPGVDAPAVVNAGNNDTGEFGFHMWAEAWVGPDQWVPMDAALNGFDVGHIAITKSALEQINPLVDLGTPITQLMASLKIEVVKTVSKRDMPPLPKVVHARPSPTPPPINQQPAPESVPAPDQTPPVFNTPESAPTKAPVD